ncbi:hypothetical protein [Acrocarpospora catenulata]|uniref:hypothetical protein n=1 Tax=Acrocarpospora catenulata TaxID=2836182 RepID=UPI0027DF5EC5|nr:hypothetical protein [Acrocarpospora catenulata]
MKKSTVLALTALTVLSAGAGIAAVANAQTRDVPAVAQGALPPGYQLIKLPNANVGNFERRTLFCPGAKRVLGGGAEAQGPNAVLVGSFPTDDGRGWIGIGRQIGANGVGISVFAVCAD